MLRTAIVLLLAAIGAHALGGSERTLSQAQTPGFNDLSRPLSSTPDDLAWDPAGRAALLARLGNPPGYFGSYQYPWPEGQYAIDPKIDPAVVAPIPGNDSPQNGTYYVKGNSGMIAVHSIYFPNEEVLFYGRPAEPWGGGDPGGPGLSYLDVQTSLTIDNGTWSEISAIYDLKTDTYEPFHIPEAPFCGAQLILPDGRALIVGGEHVNLWYPHLQYGGVSVRIFDYKTKTIETVNYFQRARWYPSVVTMADGNILIVGGGQQEIGGWGRTSGPISVAGEYENQMTKVACEQNSGPGDPYWDNPTYEIYDPESNTLTPALTLTQLLEAFPINLIPFLWVLPSGAILSVAGTIVQAAYFTPQGVTRDEEIGILPDLPIPVGANQYTPITLLTLEPPNYPTTILVAGGSAHYCPNTKSPAGNHSFLLDASPGANHTLITEDLHFRRIGGDLINLPDGRIFLCNGAGIGTGGGGGPRYSNYADPTTRAEIYNPSAPIGQRWTAVGDSQIPRLYHSVAFLTTNATILIAGSETTSDRRIQIYTPDYLLNGNPRPVITSAPETVAYGADIRIEFTGVDTINRAVLHRPSSPTHSNHFDNRAVALACQPASGGSVTCTAPPNANIAPPGPYLLFILSAGTPSKAVYVTFPTGQPPAPPAENYELVGAYGQDLTGTTTAPSRGGPLAAQAPQVQSFIGPQAGTSGHRDQSADIASEINPNGRANLGGTSASEVPDDEASSAAQAPSTSSGGGTDSGGTGATAGK